VGDSVEPGAGALAEFSDQQFDGRCRQFADGIDAQADQPLGGLGADAVDFCGQGPDSRRNLFHVEDGDAVWLVEVDPIFDSSLLGEMPIEQVRPVASKTACLMRQASASVSSGMSLRSM
jgi:hypothetical protein